MNFKILVLITILLVVIPIASSVALVRNCRIIENPQNLEASCKNGNIILGIEIENVETLEHPPNFNNNERIAFPPNTTILEIRPPDLSNSECFDLFSNTIILETCRTLPDGDYKFKINDKYLLTVNVFTEGVAASCPGFAWMILPSIVVFLAGIAAAVKLARRKRLALAILVLVIATFIAALLFPICI